MEIRCQETVFPRGMKEFLGFTVHCTLYFNDILALFGMKYSLLFRKSTLKVQSGVTYLTGSWHKEFVKETAQV